MNILITLPRNLIEKIISGEKEFEMRKCLPKHMTIGEDGFFVVEKGTNIIRCWCRIDDYVVTFSIDCYVSSLGVPEEYVKKYANGKKVYLWKIGKVKVFQNFERDSLRISKNPQQFVYCPLSYGESY